MKTTRIKFISDPGHGWAEFSTYKLIELGIAAKISGCSYISRDCQTSYIEEDCDAAILIDALKAAGHKIEINEVYQENTFIRDLPQYPTDEFIHAAETMNRAA